MAMNRTWTKSYFSDEKVKDQFDTNVLAALPCHSCRTTPFASTGFCNNHECSSIGGIRGYPSNGIYCATKLAIKGLTLRRDLKTKDAPIYKKDGTTKIIFT